MGYSPWGHMMEESDMSEELEHIQTSVLAHLSV